MLGLDPMADQQALAVPGRRRHQGHWRIQGLIQYLVQTWPAQEVPRHDRGVQLGLQQDIVAVLGNLWHVVVSA